jgi:oligopeptide transport system substrate-binding protein
LTFESSIDDYTLEIKLNTPLPYFDEIMTFSATYPVNEKFYNSVKDTFALDKNSLLYNGPYMITEWIPNGEYAMTKNPYYWNKANIKIENVKLIMVENYNTAANMFKSGDVDITPISGDQLVMFEGSKDLHRIADSVWFFKFNVTNKYFKNEKIRQAISMAINREVYCEDIRKDGSAPAYAFVPPGISGGKVNGKKITFRERCGETYFKYDPKEAKKLFNEGLKELGLKRPVNVKLLTDNSDVSRRDGQFLQEELNKNLGINVTLDPNTFQSRLRKTELMDYDFCMYGWLPDYNDPNTFMNMWVTKGGNNNTGFSNIKYDSLINIAETSPDNEARMQAMQKAEKMLMDKMIIAPLYFRSTNYLIKPYIKDFVLRGLGVKASFVWAYDNRVKNLK